MPEPFIARFQVRFRDTDAAGIMHFSTYFTYMEEAEHALLRREGLSVSSETDEGVVSWPRVDTACSFRGAVRFEECFEVRVVVRAIGRSSVTYGFEFVRARETVGATPAPADVFAEGRIVAVCCLFRAGHPPQSISIPDTFRRALARYQCDRATDATERPPAGAEPTPEESP